MRTIRRDVLEETVISALQERLMDPALYAVFAKEFTTEWNSLQAASAGERETLTSELQRLRVSVR